MRPLSTTVATALAAAVLFAPAARAQPIAVTTPAEPAAARGRLLVGVRAGWALAQGDLEKGAPLDDLVGSAIPISLEVSWKLGGHLAVGAIASYGFGAVASKLDSDCKFFGSTCTVRDYRVGLQAAWDFLPRGRLDPWVGLGIGYEWLQETQENGGLKATLTYRGFDWVNVQGGLDFRFGALGLGPYLSWDYAVFSSMKLVQPGGTQSQSVASTASHGWLGGGVRVFYAFL